MFESLYDMFVFGIALGIIIVVGKFLFSIINKYITLTKGRVAIGLFLGLLLLFSGNDTLSIIGIIIYFIFAFIGLGKFIFSQKNSDK